MSENYEEATTQKARLLKVLVQPVFVLDDGEDLIEVVGNAVEVSTKHWADYSAGIVTAETAEQVVEAYNKEQRTPTNQS